MASAESGLRLGSRFDFSGLEGDTEMLDAAVSIVIEICIVSCQTLAVRLCRASVRGELG